MTRRRAATTLLVLLAALVWAPLGASSLGVPAVAVGATASGLQKIVPGSSPSPGAETAAPAPAVSSVASATPFPAPAATAIVVAHAVTGGAKPAASPAAAGTSASPATVRSASPAASSHPQPVPSPAVVSDRPAPGQLARPGAPGTLLWLLAGLTGLALVGSLLFLLGRRHSRRVRPVVAGYAGDPGFGRPIASPAAGPDGSPVLERRRSARGPEEGIERRRTARLQPADDPILRAMGLGADAPAAGGARAVRARARRVRQGLEPRPEDERPA